MKSLGIALLSFIQVLTGQICSTRAGTEMGLTMRRHGPQLCQPGSVCEGNWTVALRD